MLFPHTNLATSLLRSDFLIQGSQAGETGRMIPAVGLSQTDDTAMISAELPGIDPKDIEISVKANVLTISGERKRPDHAEQVTWIGRARHFGPFSRSFRIPFEIDAEKTEAELSNGVLEVTVHRREEDKPLRIQVKAA